MTRLLLLLSFVASCSLLSAQQTTSSPAPGAVLQTSLVHPSALTPVRMGSAKPAAPHPVFSGQVPPRLLHWVKLDDDGARHYCISVRQRVVVVSLTVDVNGIPKNVTIVDPEDGVLDQEVQQAVSRFRYQAGTLDGQPADYPVRLNYVLKAGALY
jgi:TonB family protein